MASPYHKYRKAPFRYSAIYQRWKQAVVEGRSNDAARLGREHDRQTGMDAYKGAARR